MTPEEYLRLLRSETIDKELPFDLKEYRGRVTKVREEMGKNGIDALVVCTPANLNYLTGYSTFSPTNFTGLILPLEGEPSVVTAECEIPAVILSGWVEDVQPFFLERAGQTRQFTCRSAQSERIVRPKYRSRTDPWRTHATAHGGSPQGNA